MQQHHTPSGQSLTVPGAPYKLSATPWRQARPAPRLGEHTTDILTKLGYDLAAQAAAFEIGSDQLNRLPLEGIRVADFTWIGAGSFTTKLLADHGADVIKIESHGRMDSLRSSRPYQDGIPGINRSGYFADRNSSKRSVTLDMKTAEGQELARRLIATSDVVANNFTPGTMEKFGLGYEAVREIKQDIVYIAMSMQGASGPEHKYLGYGLTMGALTGLQFLSGLPDREPAEYRHEFLGSHPQPLPCCLCSPRGAPSSTAHWRGTVYRPGANRADNCPAWTNHGPVQRQW